MLTVLFATHNGTQTLPTMLESFTRLVPPPGGWRIVAVDNGSNDETGAMLRSYRDALPLRVVEEPRRGKNNALNTGLQKVDGDLVVLTDDDIVPDPHWLCRLAEASELQPEYDIFGGAIHPRWPFEPPAWLWNDLPIGVLYAATPADLTTGPVRPGLICGANMAVRRRVFEAGLSFDGRVGPAAGAYRMGSETDFTYRATQAGFACWHVAEAMVEHIVRPHQLELDWILARAYRFGRGSYWRKRVTKAGLTDSDASPPKAFGIPRWCYRAFLDAMVMRCLCPFYKNYYKKVSAKWEYRYWLGFFYEYGNSYKR